MNIQKPLFDGDYSEEFIARVRQFADQQLDMDYNHSAFILNSAADKMENGMPLSVDEAFEVKHNGALI